MKILIVADRFFPSDPGGLARVAWDIATAWARLGHTVEFIASESGPGPVPESPVAVNGVNVHRFTRPLFPAWHPQRISVPTNLYARAVARAAASTSFDVVHCHSIFTGLGVMRGLRDMSRRPAVVYTIHSPVAQEQRLTWSQQGLIGIANTLVGVPIVRRMERELIEFADAVHVLSRYTVDQLRIEHPNTAKAYEIIPHFVTAEWRRTVPPHEARARLGWDQAIPSLFSVRQLRYRYGIEDAVEAVAPLAASGRCRFHVAGDGPDRDKLQRLIESRGCRDHIVLMGKVSDDTLRMAYQAADLFLLPTRYLECFGLISVEAMSHGIPVLGTRVGAIPEVIEPVLPGFLAPPRDPPLLREKIEAFLDGRLRAPSEAELCRYVCDHYSEKAVMSRYAAMYAAAVAGRTAPPRERPAGL